MARIAIVTGGARGIGRGCAHALAEKGWFVLLTAQPEVIRARIARKRDRLLTSGKITPEFISTQACTWESRYAGYSDCRVDSGRLGVDEAAEAIVAAWQNRAQ